jgi:DNA-binding MarR family transcriptional regulator
MSPITHSCKVQLCWRLDAGVDMTENSPESAGTDPGGRASRRGYAWGVHDSLGILLDRLVRTAGLLQPDQPMLGQPVSLSEAYALAELAGDAPLSQRDLAVRLDLEKSTVSRLVAGLERRGHVRRQRDPTNRRYYQITLTDQGRSTVAQLATGMRRRHAQILGAMTEAERNALAIGVSALLRAMGRMPPLASPPEAAPAAGSEDHER